MPSLSVLDRRIPPNPKYASIQSVIDTGASRKHVSKFLSDQQLAKRRSEHFRRAKPGKLAEWLKRFDEVCESVYDIPQKNSSDNSVACMSLAPSVVAPSVGIRSVVESTLTSSSFARGGLLVDLRDFEEYKRSRISNSINHPGILIPRDIFSPQLIEHKKRVKGRPLIVYHKDDRKTSLYAALLVEKGWEEVWVLDGGYEDFKDSYPELVES